MKAKEQYRAAAELRLQAEAVSREKDGSSPEGLEALSPEAARRMLHELRVHQIELEMQNDELRRAQVELDVSRVRYFDLYDLAPVGYCTVNEQDSLLEVNLTAANLLGADRSALLGKAFSSSVYRESQDNYYLHRKQLLEGGKPQVFELQMVKGDGEPFWARLVSSSAEEMDGTSVQRIVLNDITEHRRTTEELDRYRQRLADLAAERTDRIAELNRELAGRVIEADLANRSKSDLLATMSHEVRTPMAVLIDMTERLQQTKLDSEQDQLLGKLDIAGQHLLALLDNVLDMAKLEAGKLALEEEAVDINELLRQCCSMMSESARTKGLEIVLDSRRIPDLVQGDRTRLMQALLNYLGNAIKFSERGEISVRAQLGEASGDRLLLRFEVRDEGVGVDTEVRHRLFHPFGEADNSTSRRHGGLGLVVVRQLAQLMGGDAGHEANEGGGSTFWFSAALRRVAAPPDA